MEFRKTHCKGCGKVIAEGKQIVNSNEARAMNSKGALRIKCRGCGEVNYLILAPVSGFQDRIVMVRKDHGDAQIR